MPKSTKEEFQAAVKAHLGNEYAIRPAINRWVSELDAAAGVHPIVLPMLGHDPHLDQLLTRHAALTRSAQETRLAIYDHLHGRQEDAKK